MPVACFWCKRWMRFYEEEYFFFYEYNEAKDVPHFYKWGWYILTGESISPASLKRREEALSIDKAGTMAL